MTIVYMYYTYSVIYSLVLRFIYVIIPFFKTIKQMHTCYHPN